MTDRKGQFLYEMVQDHLAAQAEDQKALAGRAKDLIGYTAISSTITGAIANDRLFDVDKGVLPQAFVIFLSVGVTVTLVAGLYVLRPRTWYFATRSSDLFTYVSEHLDDDVDSYYGAAARGFANPGPFSETESAIDINGRQLGRLEKALYVQLVGVASLAVSGLALALIVLT